VINAGARSWWRIFDDIAAVLNSIVFGKILLCSGGKCPKDCRLWSRYIEILVDLRLFIVLYCSNWIHAMYFVDCSRLYRFKKVFPGQMLISLLPQRPINQYGARIVKKGLCDVRRAECCIVCPHLNRYFIIYYLLYAFTELHLFLNFKINHSDKYEYIRIH
jgi:hypothetical protein